MGDTRALAAARHRLLRDRGVDVEKNGLGGAPPLRILTSENRHESIIRAVRLLGIGTGAIELLPCDDLGGIKLQAPAASLDPPADSPPGVRLPARALHTRSSDPF